MNTQNMVIPHTLSTLCFHAYNVYCSAQAQGALPAPQAAGSAPQGFTWTPLCGQAAAQYPAGQGHGVGQLQGQGAAQAAYTVNTISPIGCTIPLVCQPAAQVPGQGAAQAAYTVNTISPIGCTLLSICPPAAQAQGQGAAQAAYTVNTISPIGCTILSVCPPADQMQAVQAQHPYFTFTPVCGQQGAGAAATAQGGTGMTPMATLGPINCQITVFSLCTPVCGQ